MSPTSTTAATAISTNRSFGNRLAKHHRRVDHPAGTTDTFVSGAKMPTMSPEGECKPDRDEDLLDGASVEGTDEHELDRRGDHRADEARTLFPRGD